MIHQGDIIIARFLFADLTEYKTRPAVVVSNSSVNSSGDVIAVGISTSSHNFHSVAISHSDIVEGRIRSDRSFIHCDKIQRLNRNFITGSVGHVSTQILAKVFEKIYAYLKLEN